MIDPTKEVKRSRPASEQALSRNRVLQAVVFGLVFGFLLQKAGVAKYHVLIGVLFFQDFTVIQVMGTAILVGMIGILILDRRGLVELKIKPTRLASVILGGLIFGAGFGFSGYCPGTGIAALGQMNWDAIFMIIGMLLGSYLFAEASERLSQTVDRWGNLGKLLLPDLLHAPRVWFVAGLALMLVAALLLLEKVQ